MTFAASDKGKFALVKGSSLVEVLVANIDAHKMAKHLFEDGIYSVQEIDPVPIDLGFMNDALVQERFQNRQQMNRSAADLLP